MAYLFGWHSDNLGALTNTGNVGSPNQIRQFDFTVPEDCTVQQIHVGFRADEAGDRVRAYLIDEDNGRQIIASSGDSVVSDEGHTVFDMPPTQVSEGATISIALHLATYTQVHRETSYYSYYDTMEAEYDDPPPDAFVEHHSGNRYRFVLYADGITEPPLSVNSVTSEGQSDTLVHGSTATLSTTNLPATQGYVRVESNDGLYTSTLSIVSWDATNEEIVVDVDRGQLPFGETDNFLIVETASGSQTIMRENITMQAPAGTTTVNGTGVYSTADNSIFKNVVSAPTGSFQIIIRDPNNVDPVIDSLGGLESATNPGNIIVSVWDSTDGTTSNEVTFTIEDVSVDATITSITVQSADGSISYTQPIDTVVEGENIVNISFDKGNLKYGYDYILVVEHGDGHKEFYPDFGVLPGDGTAYVDIDSVNEANPGIYEALASYGISPEVGQQVEYTDTDNTTVFSDGTYTQDNDEVFNVRVWEDGTWSEWLEVGESIFITDVSPNPSHPGSTITITLNRL